VKLIEDIEQKFTMQALSGYQAQVTRIKWLFWAQLEKAIVTKKHSSNKK